MPQVNCGYSKCIYDGRVEKEDAIKVKSQYFHLDCHLQKQERQKVFEMFRDNFFTQDKPAMIYLVIDNLIKKQVSFEYMMYAIQYAKQNCWKFQSCFGLYKLMENEQMRTMFNKIKAKLMQDKEIETVEESTFKSLETKSSNDWSQILRR